MRKLVAVGVGILLAIACSSDEETNDPGGDPSCGDDPWSCGAGQTCWPVSTSGSLECIDAPTDQIEGAPCELVVGEALCAPHLYCFPSAPGSSTGVCSPFCNQGVCQNGGSCETVAVIYGKQSVRVCTLNVGDSGTGGDAGTDSSTGGTGGSSGSGGIAGSGGTVTGGTGGVAGSAGNGGTAGQGGSAGASQGGSAGASSGGSAGASSGGSAGASQGGSAGASQGGSAGASSGGASGSAGATF